MNFDWTSILTFLKQPAITALVGVLIAWLARKSPGVASFMHTILDALGLKFSDPRADKQSDVVSATEVVAGQICEQVLVAWKAGDVDEAKKLLDAAVIVTSRNEPIAK
jgi:hypothetical protein